MTQWFDRFSASCVAAATAEVVTLPFDYLKVMLQLNGSLAGNQPKKSILMQVRLQFREEGMRSFWKGLTPALIRQCSYTSIAMALYDPLRDMWAPPGTEASVFSRLFAGGLGGAIGIALMNPTEVIKTRIQGSKGNQPMASVARQVWTSSGVKGFWAGVQPNVIRCFFVNAAELGSYDAFKQALLQSGMRDGLLAHVCSSGLAGVCSALVSTPLDVAKTRLQFEAGMSLAERHRLLGHSNALNAGLLKRMALIALNEGFGSLYSGFVPIVVRKVCWVTAFFVTFEQIKLLRQT